MARRGTVHGVLQDPAMRRMRALLMLEHKVRNTASNAEVAKEFKVSERTVERAFSFLKKAELVASAEDQILDKLVPAAMAALGEILSGDNDKVRAQVALGIFKGTLPGFSKQKTSPNPSASPGDSLESYLSQLRGDLEQRGLVEGEVVPLISATATSFTAQGNDEPNPGEPAGGSNSSPSPQTMGLGVDEGTPDSAQDGMKAIWD